MASFIIRDALIPGDLPIVSDLFTAYTTWLNVDLAFQDFASELASLPGKYARPAGCILLAVRASQTTGPNANDGQVLGCIALRPLGDQGDCEMKRLYTTPEARGQGVGRALVAALVKEAKNIGYKRMLLDTLGHMQSAIKLYEGCGFKRTEPYYHNPLGNVVYFSLELDATQDKMEKAKSIDTKEIPI